MINVVSVFFKKNLLLVLIALIGLAETAYSQHSVLKTKHIVEIKNMKFNPSELTVQKGDTVVWVNRDIFPHNVTETENKKWTSATLQQGKSWSKVITESYTYYCSLHVVMQGKIIVTSKH